MNNKDKKLTNIIEKSANLISVEHPMINKNDAETILFSFMARLLRNGFILQEKNED